MSGYSIDVRYAYARLGLEPGASLDEIRQLAIAISNYKFSTNERIETVRRFAEYFAIRERLGPIHEPFERIRKAYHHHAMALHPDRNKEDKAAEERLKILNNAYEIVERVQREANDYYKTGEQARRLSEQEAREAVAREQSRSKAELSDEIPASPNRPSQQTQAATKYMAASIPRFIRTARLGYLNLQSIIGTRFTKNDKGANFVFDIIMLPEREFLRMRTYLAVADIANPALQRGSFAPAFIPADIKTLTIPEDENEPEKFARDYFRKEFKIDES